MNKLEQYHWGSNSTVRCGGYALLLLAFIDFVNIFIPLHFTNPVWEFQTIGLLVDHAPVPLIGLIFVFVGGNNYREKIEIYLLKFLSWAALVVGILFILLLPLGINNTLRINQQNQIQVLKQSSQKLAEIQQIKEMLNQVKTEQDLEKIFHFLNHQDKPDFTNIQDVKGQLLTQILQMQKNINNQYKVAENQTRQELLRNAVKWNLGALICGVAFILVWSTTIWARLN